ncbi:MAG TPA: hypothetical protein VF727_10470 [Allosphingosinicella sp.]
MPAPICCTIAKLTPVELEITDKVSSRSAKPGDKFAIRLAEPLVVDGHILAPAGASGIGEVVHAAKGGGMGKAGELILAARYIEVGDRHIPLRTLRYGRSQGKDNSTAATAGSTVAGALVPVGALVGFLVQGGEVDIPAGTRANAKIAADTAIAPAE